MNKLILRNHPLALLIGTGLGMGAIGVQTTPVLFQATDLAAGYGLASADDATTEASCGAGTCSADMGRAASDNRA